MDSQSVGIISLAFAGAVQLAAIAFLLGGLFQRVRSLESRTRELESGGNSDGARRTDLLVRLGRLEKEVEMSGKQTADAIGSLQNVVNGLSRQVASLTTRRRGAVPPMADTLSDE